MPDANGDNKTRSGLTAASISSLDGTIIVHCMFNPEHYSVTKKNSYSDPTEPALRKPPKPEFKSFGRSTLKLSTLIFDTYESGDDLTQITNKLWDFMRPAQPSDPESVPPEVKFQWSTFQFQAYIESMTMKYTLFDKDGNPVRAEVEITFKESDDPTKHPHERQNPTSGGEEIRELRRVVRGDRLDLIAADVYGDATKWRLIADYNHIDNPLAIRPGQMLTIPPL